MYLLPKIVLFSIILEPLLGFPQNYAFDSAVLSYKRNTDQAVKNRTFKLVTAIDQHLFADAVDLKVRTKHLRMFEGAVKNLPLLKTLRIKNCGIASLAPNCFRNLPNIETIHLQENLLTVIENRVFNYLPVKELWLQKNGIRTIRSGAFDNMPNLQLIKLNSNKLTKWDSRWFANTPKLSGVYFRRNQIAELPPKAFVNIKPSHKIDNEELVDTKIFLSRNQISYIHPEALFGIDALDELCLRRNKLEDIDRRVFAHITELHKLNLTMNFLSKLEADTFESLSEMHELDLSGNFFKCIPYEISSKVKKIDISDNNEIDCACIYNLREKMKEERINNEIVESTCAFD